MREWAIYELHRDGKVIYVGMTSDTAKRYGEHREKRPFLMNVVEWFQCEEKARDAEVAMMAAAKECTPATDCIKELNDAGFVLS